METFEKKERVRSDSANITDSYLPICNAKKTVRIDWLIICFALLCFLISPAMAGEKYMAGYPELKAHIAGTNEFSPGDDVNLRIVVENTGLNQFKFVQSSIVDRNDLSSTAKQLTASLNADSSPIIVKADPQIIGDLTASTNASAIFRVKINQDAKAGTYQIPLFLNYSYLYQQEQEGTDTVLYRYKQVNDRVDIPVNIKPEVQIAVLDVKAENLNAGNEGYATITVQNVGYEDGQKATVRILQNDKSPIIPSEGSAYIGDFPQGATADCRFRLMVSDNAQKRSYPLDIFVNYKNSEGDFVNSKNETIGIPVGEKVIFNVTPVKASIPVGGKAVITAQYQNTGGSTAFDAQARINAVDPFTSNDDTSFLGTMAPGDIQEAAFEISAGSSGTVKEYGLDSEVIYRDSLNNQINSDPMKLTVQIVPAQNIVNVLGLPVLLVIILIVLALGGYFVYKKRSQA